MNKQGCIHPGQNRKNIKHHLALYGNTPLERGSCPGCHSIAIIHKGRYQCCDYPANGIPKTYVRICEPEQKRKLPSVKERLEILDLQGHRCFYCDIPLGSTQFRKGKPIKIQTHWDHQLPYSYSQNNHTYNYVAACHVCNGLKSNKLFQTVEEAQVYLADKRKQKGYNY